MRMSDLLFSVLAVGFVAVLCLAGISGGLDLSTRRARSEALIGSLILGGGFSLLTGAWIGWCFPLAVVVLMAMNAPRRRTRQTNR